MQNIHEIDPDMKKVLIVTNIPSPYRVKLFNYLQSSITEYDFHILYTSLIEDDRSWEIDLAGHKNYTVLKTQVIKLRQEEDNRYIRIPFGITKQIDVTDPDIVIAFEYNLAAVLSFVWCKKNKRKFIHLTDGTLYSERNIGFLQRVFRKLLITKSDACIASSSEARRKLLAWGADRKKIFISLLTVDIKGYLNTEPVLHDGDYNNRLLYVGSFVKRKGLDLLIDSLSMINIPFELRIVGDGTGEQKAELLKKIKKLGTDQKVILTGFLEGEKLMAEYASADIFILPTREDCFGLVLIEAVAAGNIVVASKYADGAVDVLNGKTGYIVDPYDARSFSEKIEKAMTNKKQREYCIGHRAENTEKFSFEKTSTGYINALRYVE